MGIRKLYPMSPLEKMVDVYDSMRVPVKKADRKPGPYPYYGASGIADYVDSYIFDGEYLLLAEDGENLKTRNTPIAFLASGKFWVNNHAHILQANSSSETRFLCYALQIADVNSYLSGSTRPKLTQGDMRRIPVFAPKKSIKKAIAHVLGSLDDRIELNRRMNETLESMAQALFKSWFVDFDPVIDNALASGKEIPEELSKKAQARAALGDKRRPLPDEICTLFPDEFTYSDELGWVPLGWEVKSIDEILKTVSETYPLKNVEKVVFLNTGDILDGHFLHQKYSDTSSLPGQAKKSIMKDDILYSEIRPKNRRFAYVYFDSPEYVVSTRLMVLRAKSNIKSVFSYYILKQQTCIDYLQMMAESRSGTFPQITFDVLSTIKVALPHKHTIIEYFLDNLLERLFQKTVENNNNSKCLSTLRDTLLPKLLSGELRIPDAEKMVEELAL